MDYPFLLLLFFATLLIAFGIYTYSAKKAYQEKFQDYRTLAEGLRVQFYWKCAGIPNSAANHYLGDQHSELDWIRHALRIWALPFSEEAKKEHSYDPHSETKWWKFLLNDWVTSQYEYFSRSSVRENAKVARLNLWARIWLVFGFCLVAFNTYYQYFIGYKPLLWFLYISSVTPIAAGLLYAYSEKRALADHVKQYDRMSNLFLRAKLHLEQLIEDKDFSEILIFLLAASFRIIKYILISKENGIDY